MLMQVREVTFRPSDFPMMWSWSLNLECPMLVDHTIKLGIPYFEIDICFYSSVSKQGADTLVRRQ